MNEKVLFDKEKELLAKFDEIADLRMKLDEEEKQRREEVRRFQSQLQSAEDYAIRLASEKHRAEQFEKGTHSFESIIGSKFASSINNFRWRGLSTIKFTGQCNSYVNIRNVCSCVSTCSRGKCNDCIISIYFTDIEYVVVQYKWA